MKSDAFSATANQMGWDGQVEAGQLFPKERRGSMPALMAQIASGKLISPAVSARLQQKLETTPADDPMRLLFHQRYGAKDGVTAGVLSLISYATPKSGPLAGRPCGGHFHQRPTLCRLEQDDAIPEHLPAASRSCQEGVAVNRGARDDRKRWTLRSTLMDLPFPQAGGHGLPAGGRNF